MSRRDLGDVLRGHDLPALAEMTLRWSFITSSNFRSACGCRNCAPSNLETNQTRVQATFITQGWKIA